MPKGKFRFGEQNQKEQNNKRGGRLDATEKKDAL